MDQEKEKEIIRLFKIRRTVLQMLKDRNYIIAEKLLNETLDQFRSTFVTRENLSMISENAKKERIFVSYEKDEKITLDHMENFSKKIFNNSVQRGILIYKGILTKKAEEIIEQLDEIKIEAFKEDELLVNITEHELVPKHIIISDEEKKALLEKYKVKESQLPKILINDPIARYLGLKKQQVVKIIRNSETAGQYITYRIVI